MSNLTAIIQSVGGVTNHVAHEGFTRHTGTRPLVGTLNRSLASGEVLNVYDGSTLLGQAVVAGTHWAYSDRRSLIDGQTVAYSARLSGTSNPGPAYRFTVDTTPPPAPTIASVIDDVGAVQGEVARGGTTDDTRLRIRVGLSPTHQAGGKLMLFDGATALGQEVVLEAQDINQGAKEIHTPTLRAGAAYQFKAVVTDLAGNTAESGAHAVNIAATVRNAPRIAFVRDGFGEIQGDLQSGATTDDRFLDVRIDLTATGAVQGDRFRLLNGTQLLWQEVLTQTDIDNRHKWVMPLVEQPDGINYALRAVVDQVVNAGSPQPVYATGLVSDAFNVVLETQAPTIVRLFDNVGTVRGGVVDQGVTDDRDLNVRVGLWKTEAVAKERLRVFVRHDGVTTVAPTYVLTNEDLTAGFKDVPLPRLTGSSGYSLTARVESPGFEGAESVAHRFTIDTVAPNSPASVVVVDDVGSVRGTVAHQGRTDDQELVVYVGLAGTNAVAGDSVELMDGQRRIATFDLRPVHLQAPEPFVQISTPRLLAGATYNLAARVVDAAGNVGALSSVTQFTVDTTAPSAPTIVDVIDSSVSWANPGGSVESLTDDRNLEVRIKVAGTLAVPGDTLELHVGGVLMKSHMLTSGNFSGGLSPGQVNLTTDTLTDGQHTLQARIVDVAGNRSAHASRTVVVDTVAPSAPTITSVTDDVGRVQGLVAGNGGVTDDLLPVVRVNFNKVDVALGGTVRLFNGSRGLEAAGDTVVLEGVDIQRGWVDMRPALVVDTTYQLNAVVVDRAGNRSVSSANHHFVTVPVLTSAPRIVSVDDDVGAVQGAVRHGGATDDAEVLVRLDLAGTGAVAGDRIELLSGDVSLGSKVIQSVAEPLAELFALPAGLHNLSARVLDGQLKLRTESSAVHEITVDTTAPRAPLALRVVDDFGPTRSTSLANGASTDDLEMSVYVSFETGPGAQAARAGDTVVLRDGTRVLAQATLTDNDIAARAKEMVARDLVVGLRYDLNALIVDEAGNTGAQSVTHVVHTVHRLIDAPSIVSVVDDVGGATGLLTRGAKTDDAHLAVQVRLSETNAQAGDFVLLYNGSSMLPGFVPVKLEQKDIVAGFLNVQTSLLADGHHALNARIADNAGRTTQASATHAVEVDTTDWVERIAPYIFSVTDDVGTVQGPVARTGSTDDVRPVVRVDLSATRAQPDDLVFLYDDRNRLGDGIRLTSEDLARGYIDLETPELSDGAYPLRARIQDRKGHETALSMPHTIYVDTTVQPVQRMAPTISRVFDDAGPVKGVLSNGGVTDDRDLALRIQLEGTNAVANDSLFIYDGDSPTPLATLMNGIQLDHLSSGFIDISVNGFPDRTYALRAVIVDNDGPRASDRSAAFGVTVDRQAPGAPRISEVYDDVAGAALADGAVTADTTPRVTIDLRHSGAVEGDTLILRSGTRPPMLTRTLRRTDFENNNGLLELTLPALTNGQRYELNAVLADPAGNWSEASQNRVFEIQQSPPRILSVHDDRGGAHDRVGAVPNGGLTNDTTPTLRVGLADTNARRGDFVVLYDEAGVERASVQLNSTPAPDGSIDVSPTLSHGQWILRAAIRYGQGPTAPLSALSQSFTIDIDAVAPGAPTLTGVFPLSGSVGVAPGSRTDHDAFLVSGGLGSDQALKAGDTLILRDGSTQLMTMALTAEQIQSRTWSFSTPRLVHGKTYDLNVVLNDQAGNLSAASGSYSFTVNQLAPSILSVTDDQGLTQGELSFAAWTDDASPTFRIGLHNTNARAGDRVVMYSGTTPISGAEFVLTDGDVRTRRYKDVDLALADGYRSISAAIVDQNGDRSRISQGIALNIDTVAPQIAPQITSVSAGGQSVGRDGYTSVKMLSVTVGLGASVRAGDTVSLRAGSTELSSEKVTQTEANARSKTFTTPSLIDGTTYAFNAVLTDRAGNRGSAGNSYTVHIDETPPNAPRIVSVTDDVGLLKGPLVSGGVTDDDRLLVRVSLESSNAVAGDTVRLFDGNTPLGSPVTLDAQDIAEHAKDITTPVLGAGRAYQLHAKVIDRAGNVGAASDAFALTIDKAAPTVTAVNVYAKNGKPLNEAQLLFGEEVVVEVVFDSDLVLRNSNIALDQFSPSIRASLSPANLAGLPTLSINMGGQTASMSLVSMLESGGEAVTEKLTFVYKVPKNQTATDVIWVGENALSLNSYTLHDPAGNAANANHAWAGAGVKAAYGTAADDLFVVSRADLQALYAGAADDPLVRIDGKGGIDTLRLVEGGMVLDLTQMAEKRLQGIERIDMTTPTSPTPVADELRVTAADVLDISRQNVWNVDGNANIADAVSQLMVTGNATDRVYLSVTGEGGGEPVNSGWTRRATNFQHEGVDYQVWNSVEENAQVLVRLNMQVFTGG